MISNEIVKIRNSLECKKKRLEAEINRINQSLNATNWTEVSDLAVGDWFECLDDGSYYYYNKASMTKNVDYYTVNAFYRDTLKYYGDSILNGRTIVIPLSIKFTMLREQDQKELL